MAKPLSSSAPVPDPAPPPSARASAIDAFVAAVRAALDDGGFESLVLAKSRASAGDPRAIRIRRIALKGEPVLSFVASHATRDLTRNCAIEEGLAAIAGHLDGSRPPAFAHATLKAADGETQLLVAKRGTATLRPRRRASSPAAAGAAATTPTGTRPAAAGTAARTPAGTRPAATTAAATPVTATPLTATAATPAAHDRERLRRLPIELPFLVELGITDASHRVVPAMARKWRQLDKFLEVLDHAIDALPPELLAAARAERPLRVVDYGCGKGYLTFAVHEHLRRRFGIAPQVTGVELRAELVDFCNGVAVRTHRDRLTFVQGDLRSVAPEAMDVMIALHACDTATDHAIELGVRAGAAVLVCAPCCHKELRPQIARPRALSGLLRHGVHLGQEAEMVTDSLRALLLETCGYEARVFEFVSLEHTSKNKMIVARRREAAAWLGERARAELAELKDFYGIREQALEVLLARRAAAIAQACQTP